jgi:hypothetical protein
MPAIVWGQDQRRMADLDIDLAATWIRRAHLSETTTWRTAAIIAPGGTRGENATEKINI